MANELSTAGVLVKWACETTAGTRPTTGFTTLPNIKVTPAMEGEPSTLEVTDLSDLVWKRYIQALKDPGGAVSFTANLTSSFKSAWETLVSAYETAKASSKATWFEIYVPGIESFYFAGEPAEMGINGYEVDAVNEINVYVTPNKIVGWDTSST